MMFCENFSNFLLACKIDRKSTAKTSNYTDKSRKHEKIKNNF